MIKLKRAYEPSARTDGDRFLIERLWPRGVKKESLPIRGWLKDVAPSTELRSGSAMIPNGGRNFAAVTSPNCEGMRQP